jgi:hypothetical protein
VSRFTKGERVIGLAAYPDYDSELIEGEYYEEDFAGIVVRSDTGHLRTVIAKTVSRVDALAVSALTVPTLAVHVGTTAVQRTLSIQPNYDHRTRVDAVVLDEHGEPWVLVGVPGGPSPARPTGRHLLAYVYVASKASEIRNSDIVNQGDREPMLTTQSSDVRDTDTTERGEVLTEAKGLIEGDRNKSYGSPTQNFSNTAEVWTALLRHKLKDGEVITATEVGTLMVGLKLARTVAQPKRDNFVDMAGYAACAWQTIADAEG